VHVARVDRVVAEHEPIEAERFGVSGHLEHLLGLHPGQRLPELHA
jgi:hypothetical protein